MHGIYFLFEAALSPREPPAAWDRSLLEIMHQKAKRPRIRAAAFADWMYRFCD